MHCRQFHNDGCSSTSDLHYFYPNLRTCEWIPPVPASAPQPTLAQVTCQDFCQEPVTPNVERPSCQCMSVDQQPIKRKNEKKPTLSPTCSSSQSSTKKKKKNNKNNKNTCEKKVQITSSKSSGSLRSLIDKIKCKKKEKRKDTSKSSSKCCSNCECMRRPTKRKTAEKKDSTCQSSSSGLGWGTVKKKKLEAVLKKETKNDEKEPKKQEKDTMMEDIETKNEETSKSCCSLKSLLDTLKRKIGGLVCTPSSCDRKNQSSDTSGMTDENNKEQPATKPNTSTTSVLSLKGILAKICMKCKKNAKQEESTGKETCSSTARAPSIRVIYDRESKTLQSDKNSDRNILQPTTSSSGLPKITRKHCGCDTCIRCYCKQKAPDCECNKCSLKFNRNTDRCTCKESKNKEMAMDFESDKVDTKNQSQISYTGNEGEIIKKSQCSKDTELETDIHDIASDCKCTGHLKKFNCKCKEDIKDNACKSRIFLEKKLSNLKKLEPAQSASGDNKKHREFVCGCNQDGTDDINCDEQCRYKTSSSEKITEEQRQADCGCDKEGTNDMDCDEQCRFRRSLEKVKQSKRKAETKRKKYNKCSCDQEQNDKKCNLNCKNKCNDVDEAMVIEMDNQLENTKENEGENQKNARYNCGCDRDSDKNSCDESCKSKREIILELDLEGRVEQTIAMIDPDDRFTGSESALMSSGSSDYCSCRPNRCKYIAKTDSTCSCDSQL